MRINVISQFLLFSFLMKPFEQNLHSCDLWNNQSESAPCFVSLFTKQFDIKLNERFAIIVAAIIPMATTTCFHAHHDQCFSRTVFPCVCGPALQTAAAVGGRGRA